MKNLKSLGTVLNRTEQKSILGGFSINRIPDCENTDPSCYCESDADCQNTGMAGYCTSGNVCQYANIPDPAQYFYD